MFNNTNHMEKINLSPHLVETRIIKATKSNSSNKNKEDLLMGSLLEFYEYKPHLEQLLPILQKKSKISLRILDWFVTNYAKPDFKNSWPGVSYQISLYGRVKEFSVYDSYKAQLKAYHKKLFDPFCRRRRIYFEYEEGCEIETTPGQLNFFRWAIQNNILDYVDTHYDRIIDHMTLYGKESVEDTDKKERSTISVKISGEVERSADSITAKIGFE